MRNYFIFDGKDSRDFGVYISGQGTFKAPARSYNAIPVPGRNGALLGIDSRLENVELTYPAFIYSNFKTNLAALRAYLLSHTGYFKLSDSYHPDEYRLAYFTGPLEPDVTSANNAGEFNITFVCKPQRFLNSGDTVTSLTPGGANQRTYTGDIVSFEAESGDAITSLAAQLTPVQDLHGYSKPWAAGAGNNKAYWPTLTNASSNGIDYTISDDGNVLHIEGTATATSSAWASSQSTSYSNMPLGPYPAGTYTIVAKGFVGQVVLDRIVFTARYSDGTVVSGANSIRITSPGGVIPSGEGRVYTFTASDTFKIAFYQSIESGTAINCDVQIQLEVGSTLGNWTPYSNICPITGRTGANVNRTGKNLCRVARGWGSAQGVVYTENADGIVHCKGTATGDSFSGGSITGSASDIDSRCMYTVPAGTYTISNIAGARVWVQFRNADNTAQIATSTSVLVGASKTFTFTEPTIIYIRAYIATGTAVDADIYVMVTEGSTAATEYVPWQMQTVALDWTSIAGTVYGGTLDTVTGALSSTMANIASYNGETIGEPWLSSLDEYTPGATPTTGAQVVYTLSLPLTYQLTPLSVPLLEGENNIWTDAGDVTVVITDGQKIVNPTLFDALPLLRVYGVGTLGLGENLIVITNADSYTDIDCEIMDCFKGSVNKNQYVQFSGNDFPTLKPGDNLVTFSGITQVDIKPRWWSV